MLCNANPKNKENKITKKNGHKEQRYEVKGPREPKMTRDTKSHQLLEEVP